MIYPSFDLSYIRKHKEKRQNAQYFTCRYLDIPLRRCNFCEFVFKTLPATEVSRRNYQYLPAEVALRPKHPKCKNEKRIRFSYFWLHFWKRKTKNEFVFRFSYFTFENEKRIRFSFANLKTKNRKGIGYPFFVRKFKNEKGKTVYTRTE